MKAFLMFRDQDFNLKEPLPVNALDLIHDLELTTIFNAMSLGNKSTFEIVKKAILWSVNDEDTILYRQEILKDCLKNPAVIRDIYQIPVKSSDRQHRRWLGIFSHTPSGVLISAIKLMEMYVGFLKELKNIADEHSALFQSEGFARFFSMIKSELNVDYFAKVEYHLKQLRFSNGVLIKAELGRGNEGSNYSLRLPNSKGKNWIREVFSKRAPVYSFTISERDDAGGRALDDLRDIAVNSAANALAQATEHIDSFFNLLRDELAFYVGCINLQEQLEKSGNPIAFPDPGAISDRRFSTCDLYDVSLALTMDKKVVGNDIKADSKTLVIITGANQGGKSTFLRSVGIAQLMMQAGMFVPATEFSANLCDGVFTHFRRKEDTSMRSGKLDEELSRMSSIVDQVKPNSLILFNESFAATNEREGSEIANQITSALLEHEVKIFFVSHMYEFARIMHQKQMEDAIFLRAERRTDGQRTFKILLGEPLPISFGEDLYKAVF